MFFNKSTSDFKHFTLRFCQNLRSLFAKASKHSRRRNRAPIYSIVQTENLEDRQLLAADDLTELSDDFENAATLANWQRIYQTEGWGADQLETWNINETQAGKMVFAPHTTVWFDDYRGPLAYKEITGDFVVTTQVNISDRDDIGDSDLDDVPNGSQFSLAGLMIRTPRNIFNPELDWNPGSQVDDDTNDGENYVFFSLGWGNSGNEFQTETKTTRNSDSTLVLQNRGDNSVIHLQIARIGDTVYTLYQIPGEAWALNSRIHRPDLPETLQVGMVAYTDWEKANDYDPFYQNNNRLETDGFDPTPYVPFEPDLVAGFEFIQFDRPEIPEYLQGIDLRIQTTNLQILSFLGENVNSPLIPDPGTFTPMQVGMNLEGLADWSTAWTFTDMAHTMRSWNSVSLNLDTFQSQWGSTLFDLHLDENGWPTESQQTVNELGETIIQQYIAPILTGEVNPAGIYRAEWDGESTVWLPGIMEQGMTPEGRHYALLNLPENQDVLLTVTDINPANYFRNFNLWLPDYHGQSFAGQDWQPGAEFSPFHPLFLERLAPFETLRFMDWMETNGSDIVTWNDRAKLSDATFFGDDNPAEFHNGVAPEYMIELSNTLDANPWFNMPYQANDDYVRHFAEMVRDTLDPELTIYVEWSNEIWNYAYGFETSHWIQDQLALPENAGAGWYEFAAGQMQQDFEIWEEVFAGQEDRIVRVVAGQQANPTILENLLPAMNGNFDAISVTAYAGLGPEQLAGFNEFTTVDDVIDSLLEVTIPWSLSRLIDHQNLADQYSQILGRDIGLVTYEGGSHPDAYGWPVQAVVHEASLSPRMYDVYQVLLNSAQLIGVDLFNQYVFTGSGDSAPWGDWGLLHNMDQPLEEAFEYQSILDFINSNTQAVLPVVNIQPPASDVEESDAGQLVFTLTRSDDQLDAPLTVHYQISGTATPGDDFNELSGEVTFAANESSVSILVSILEDFLDENDEIIELQLLDQDHYDLGDSTLASGFIIDNGFTNVAPVAGFISDQVIQEGAPFTLNVSRYFSDANTVDGDLFTLSAMLAGGTLLPDWLDFNAETGDLNGTPGSTDAGTIEIVIDATDLSGLQGSTSFQLTVTPILITQYDLRIVKSPTTTSATGETLTLPPNVSFLSEWESYWVEVWGSVSNASDTGIDTFSFNLNYNTAYTTAASIQFGAAFTEDQTGQIDDASGTIQGISANTNLIDAGDDQFVLLARIEFTPTANDQVSIDFETRSIGSHQADFSLDQMELQLVDQAESQLGEIHFAETEFWAVPFDVNDDDKISFKDLSIFASVYGANVSISNSPYAWVMDINQSGTVDFKDLILFAANYGKSKINNPNVLMPSSYPDAWTPQNLVTESIPDLERQPNITPLTPEKAKLTADAAIQQYSEFDAPEEPVILRNTEIKVLDLPDNKLAQTTAGTLLLDVTVAGHGWFIDSSPWEHAEFYTVNTTDSQAFDNSEAAGRIDLLTVIYHEFEHLLGRRYETAGLLKATLSPGSRRLPDLITRAANQHVEENLEESDHFFSSLNDSALRVFG